MDFSQLGLMNGLIGKMDWLGERQKDIATNIANADTPGYEEKDLKPFTFQEAMTRMQPVATEPGHIQLASMSGDAATAKSADTYHSLYELKPDGNTVSKEQEAVKAADTTAQYNLAANVYKKTLGMLKMAISSGGGA